MVESNTNLPYNLQIRNLKVGPIEISQVVGRAAFLSGNLGGEFISLVFLAPTGGPRSLVHGSLSLHLQSGTF
jgi:hypothetical protein